MAKTVDKHFADLVEGFADLSTNERKQLVKWAKKQVKELMSLKKWAAHHKGERITAELASSIPACLSYYPVVTAGEGVVTGHLAHADDPAYSIYFAPWQRGYLRCEEFLCVFRG